MADHGYNQYCALARALEVVDGRWTLLIVRELVPGPRRFTDLLDGLPGISRKLLTERLRDLERDGVIARRELPPPAARQVYELTAEGRDLAQAMAPLIRWGAGRLGRPQAEDVFQARWAAVAMVSLADRDAAEGVHETYEYVVGNTAFHFVVEDSEIELRDGHAADPAVVVSADEQTFAQIASGKLAASAALARGALTLHGSQRATRRLAKILGLSGALPQAGVPVAPTS